MLTNLLSDGGISSQFDGTIVWVSPSGSDSNCDQTRLCLTLHGALSVFDQPGVRFLIDYPAMTLNRTAVVTQPYTTIEAALQRTPVIRCTVRCLSTSESAEAFTLRNLTFDGAFSSDGVLLVGSSTVINRCGFFNFNNSTTVLDTSKRIPELTLRDTFFAFIDHSPILDAWASNVTLDRVSITNCQFLDFGGDQGFVLFYLLVFDLLRLVDLNFANMTITALTGKPSVWGARLHADTAIGQGLFATSCTGFGFDVDGRHPRMVNMLFAQCSRNFAGEGDVVLSALPKLDDWEFGRGLVLANSSISLTLRADSYPTRASFADLRVIGCGKVASVQIDSQLFVSYLKLQTLRSPITFWH